MRAMRHAIIAAAGVALATIIAPADASAAVWRWGCMGPVGNDRILFNRADLIVVPAKPSRGTLHDIVFSDGLAKASDDFDDYSPDDDNGFQKRMAFTRDDDAKRKMTL